MLGQKLITYITVILTISISIIFYANFGKTSYTFYGDAVGYYRYLPSTFLYNTTNNLAYLPDTVGINKNIITDNKCLQQGILSPTGKVVNQYTYGVALAELPFFAVAHAYVLLFGAIGNDTFANGYSLPYHYAIKCSSIFYTLLGLWLLWLSLKKIVDKPIATITTCIILLGSNLFWFCFYQAGMSHPILFMLWAAVVYFTILIHTNFSLKYFYILGCILGFIFVTRPTDILAIVIPFLYGIGNKELRVIKLRYILNPSVLLAFLFFMLPIVPQLYYWKTVTGSWLYDSYTGNSFNFKNPHIIDGLFSFRNGWLAYSPIFYISLVGFLFLKKQWRQWLLPSIIILPVYIYIIYSWPYWNYINGFGSRPMIHLYPLLTIPMALLLQKNKNNCLKIGISIFIGFAVFINIQCSVLKVKDWIWTDEDNGVHVYNTLFKKQLTVADITALDIGQVQPTATNKIVQTLTMPNITDTIIGDSTTGYGNKLLLKNIATNSNSKWLCVSATCCTNKVPNGFYNCDVLVLEVSRNGKLLDWTSCKINNKIGLENASVLNLYQFNINTWGKVQFYYKTSQVLLPNDVVKCYLWNISKNKMQVANLQCQVVAVE